MNETVKVGDRVRVIADWIESKDKQRRGLVLGFQKHGPSTFVKIQWLGGECLRLTKEYGVLFSEDELKKI